MGGLGARRHWAGQSRVTSAVCGTSSPAPCGGWARPDAWSCSVVRRPAVDPYTDATRQALDGIVRSLAKELRARRDGQPACWSTTTRRSSRRCGSCCPARSAYVDGQAIRVGPGVGPAPADWDQATRRQDRAWSPVPRAASARRSPSVLARDGAHVVAADLPAAGEALAEVANRIGGTSLQLDIAAPDAPASAARVPGRAASAASTS